MIYRVHTANKSIRIDSEDLTLILDAYAAQEADPPVPLPDFIVVKNGYIFTEKIEWIEPTGENENEIKRVGQQLADGTVIIAEVEGDKKIKPIGEERPAEPVIEKPKKDK